MNHREGKKTFIVGGGDIGQNLAKQLAHTGHQVTLIDQSEDVVDTLGNSIDAICFQGNGASYATLQDLNAGSADLFIGVTQSDELNILSCFTAQIIPCWRLQ